MRSKHHTTRSEQNFTLIEHILPAVGFYFKEQHEEHRPNYTDQCPALFKTELNKNMIKWLYQHKLLVSSTILKRTRLCYPLLIL